MPQTGISGVCPHSIYLSPFHWDFLTPFDCLKTKGWQWKKVLWAFMAFGCHGRGVSSDTAASLQPQWPPPMGKAQLLQHWESHGKGRNALQCHISDRRTPESRGLWGESCFCCVPKIVESGHWWWKTSYSVVPLHSTGAETTQTTSPYTVVLPLWAVWDYHRWGLTNAATGKFLQAGSQDLRCLHYIQWQSVIQGNYWLYQHT